MRILVPGSGTRNTSRAACCRRPSTPPGLVPPVPRRLGARVRPRHALRPPARRRPRRPRKRRPTVTYSILGWDAINGDLGVAVQSKFPGVGSLVPYGEAEVGAVATQAFANPRHGSVGLMLLKCGATPGQAVDVLLDDDADRRARPVLRPAPARLLPQRAVAARPHRT